MVARHWVYFAGFVITGILAAGAGLIGILDGLAALSSGVPANEVMIVLTMLGAAAEWVMIVFVLGVIAVGFLAATVVSVLRNASLPRDDRLVSIVERLEQRYPLLRQFDAAGKVEPTVDDRKQQLREQYVAGEISESEFERQVAELMDDSSSDTRSQSESQSISDIEDRHR
ncbi:SHOCT domain-containing protein [Natrinema altunense]|nr:SHOCT domain-containing protein [Natrinema altunense]